MNLKQTEDGMTYQQWLDETAKLVRESGANKIITAEDINNGTINYLDSPYFEWSDGITPAQAASEIIRRLGTLTPLAQKQHEERGRERAEAERRLR